jgi:hypothetical protein
MLIACGHPMPCAAQAPARMVASIDWAGKGTWLRADFHTHTTFTDGAHSVDEVVAAALRHGCDAVAITDHGDGGLKGATKEWTEAIGAARAAYPGLIVVTGMEWNVPPGKGQEHATVLFPSQMESLETLAPFKAAFDDENKEGENPDLALRGFAALEPQRSSAASAVVFFNHPSRRPDSTSAPKLTIEALLKAAPGTLIGFEGAPGHQRSTPLGSYPGNVMLRDRWDPLAADPDNAWDQWLRKGLNVWGAIANSDFHNESGDFWPCEFASTWVYAPDRSVNGIIRAMRAGSFFAEHGHIATEVSLQAQLAGLIRPVFAGETVSASVGTEITVSLKMKVPATDYLGRENRIDAVELIGISPTETRVVWSAAPGETDALNTVVRVPAGGIVLRARGRRDLDNETALMFYTNPIRITTPAP